VSERDDTGQGGVAARAAGVVRWALPAATLRRRGAPVGVRRSSVVNDKVKSVADLKGKRVAHVSQTSSY
jgi:ABC-type nitrate/sulfonate/bicarbonate transport system substrate-binding protein